MQPLWLATLREQSYLAAPVAALTEAPVPALYAGSLSSILSCDAVEEAVEESGAVGLVVVSGVVALAEEHGHELVSGFEVRAGFAG